MSERKFGLYPGRRQVLLLAFMVAAVYVLLPQLGDFRSSWGLLEEADAGLAALAILCTASTFAAGAGTYCFLAFRRLSYPRTLLVQMAATFVNRLLPAGIGALGANYLYLRHERHTAAQAVTVAGMNNLVGLVGHALVAASILLAYAGNELAPSGWHGPDPSSIARWGLLVGLVLLVAAAVLGRGRLSRTLKGVRKQLMSYSRRPSHVAGALSTSLALTLANISSLFFCAMALDIHLPFATIMLIFTLGLGAGSAVPTPGGLGGFEAGLAAGFVGYGIDPATALAAALLYRLVSYWLPLVAGAGAFVAGGRRGLFGA
jgi:uncharacterized membrane protein YbhN (UPF0104 family)